MEVNGSRKPVYQFNDKGPDIASKTSRAKLSSGIEDKRSSAFEDTYESTQFKVKKVALMHIHEHDIKM